MSIYRKEYNALIKENNEQKIQINEKNKQIEGKNAEIQKKNEEINKKEIEILGLNTKINKYEKKIKEKRSKILELSTNLKEKDEAFKKIENEKLNQIKEKEEEISLLKGNIEDKNAEFSLLNKKIEENNKIINELETEKNENLIIINQLKEKNNERTQTIFQLKKTNNESSKTISQLKQTNNENINEISQLKQTIKENSKIMSDLEQKNNENIKKVSQLNNLNNNNKILINEKINEINILNIKINKKINDNKKLERNLEENNKQISSLREENKNLNKELSSLKLQLKESCNKNKDLNELINNKNKDISKYKINNDELKNMLISKEKIIEKLEKEPNELKIMNENLKKSNETIKNKIIERDEINNKLEEQNKKLKNDYNDMLQKYNQIENEKKNLDIEYQNLKLKLTNLEENEKKYDILKEEIKKKDRELENINRNADKSLKYESLKKEDFYDIIIKCNSINELKKGWDVLMNENGKKNYQDSKEMKYTKIGVIGSENRGKSTILSDFSQIELPTGVSIKTEGLSIKYPDLEKFKNRKIILLDSAGLETAILNSKDDEIEESSSNDKKKDENTENGNEDLNNKNKEEEKENKEFANKSRDIILLELFLQNFIIKYSDILILILGKLSINEQKLLIKVKTHIQNLNRKEPLIVIHNLKEFETKKQVNDYINNILKNSFTFSLKENEEVNLNEEESEWMNFYEPNSSPKIYHLIYGKKGTEAGDFYNEKSIKFIYNLISSLSDKEAFDPIECIKKYFVEISETILENPIKEGQIIDNREELNKGNNNANEITKIILNDSKVKFVLKKCLIDELGISNFRGNGFDAQYSYYETENNLYVYVELPGKTDNPDEEKEYEDVEIDKQVEGSYTIIKITGNKKHDTKDFIQEKIKHPVHKRQFGKFDIAIKLDKLNLDDDYNVTIKNGCLIVDFKIKKKSIKRKI